MWHPVILLSSFEVTAFPHALKMAPRDDCVTWRRLLPVDLLEWPYYRGGGTGHGLTTTGDRSITAIFDSNRRLKILFKVLTCNLYLYLELRLRGGPPRLAGRA